MKMWVNTVGQGSLWLAFWWKPVSEGLRRGNISDACAPLGRVGCSNLNAADKRHGHKADAQ